MFRDCTLSHICMHLMHFMHLEYSLMRGKVLSHGAFSKCCSKGRSIMLRSFATFCSSHFPLLMLVAQRQACWESMSWTFLRRTALTLGLLVYMTMPSFTTLLQEVISLSMPSSSTRQTRQAAISFIPLR